MFPIQRTRAFLDIRVFDRWDRIGYVASTAYREILTWIQQRQNQEIPSSTPVFLLYAAMEKFIFKNQTPSFGILSELRELLETAQHYWEIEQRVSQTEYPFTPHDQRRLTNSINEFISLLRQGTITANPYPVRTLGQRKKAITLATVFQYRASYRYHKWHFWMDIGSPLWSKGGAAVYSDPIYFYKIEWENHGQQQMKTQLRPKDWRESLWIY